MMMSLIEKRNENEIEIRTSKSRMDHYFLPNFSFKFPLKPTPYIGEVSLSAFYNFIPLLSFIKKNMPSIMKVYH
jgi:hypothetical protein